MLTIDSGISNVNCVREDLPSGDSENHSAPVKVELRGDVYGGRPVSGDSGHLKRKLRDFRSGTIRTQRPPEVLQKGNEGFLQSQCAVCLSPPIVWHVAVLQ
ncbi:hypothetical protein J6590_049226 [Homalodisca vitripennis]|nr:hypothetical protein J6590_049226 [Homalodisca vitripennis]